MVNMNRYLKKEEQMGIGDSSRKPKQVRGTPKDNPSNIFNKIAKVKKFSYDENIGVRKGQNTKVK